MLVLDSPSHDLFFVSMTIEACLEVVLFNALIIAIQFYALAWGSVSSGRWEAEYISLCLAAINLGSPVPVQLIFFSLKSWGRPAIKFDF